jgi:hypothetical protein
MAYLIVPGAILTLIVVVIGVIVYFIDKALKRGAWI